MPLCPPLVSLALLALLTVPCAARDSLVYLHDNAGSQVLGYRLDRCGNLHPLAGSPWSLESDPHPCAGNCQSLAVLPQRRLLVATGQDGLSVFRIGDDGGLDAVDGGPVGGTTLGVATVTLGKRSFVHATTGAGGTIVGFEVQADDSLTALDASPFEAGAAPIGLVSAGDLLFAADQGGPGVAAFRVDAEGTPVPAPGSPFAVPTTGTLFNLAVDPARKALWVPDSEGAVYTFAVDRQTAGLTAGVGDPLDTELDSVLGGLAVSKKLLVAGDDGPGEVTVVKRGKQGALERLGQPLLTGLSSPTVHAFDERGKLYVIASDEDDRMRAFAVTPKSGALELVDIEPLPATTSLTGIAVLRD